MSLSSHASPREGERKISETLLEFASPLLDSLGSNPAPDAVRNALKVAWTIWNAVVFEDAADNGRYLEFLRESAKGKEFDRLLFEKMIVRKRTIPRFANDRRMMGELQLVIRNGQWSLRLEAWTPPAKAS